MSDTDSFIEEVTEEVRRDRLFTMIRRYGWIGVAVIVLIVGAAAWNEWNKSQTRAAAEATGDALLAAVEANDDAARITALEGVQVESPQAQILTDFLLATHQVIADDGPAAAETLDGITTSGAEVPEIYRQIAAFKSILARGSDMPMDERRLALESMASPGMPLSLLAQEQLALADIEEVKTEEAITRLNAIVQDANVSPGLRQRATQLIVSLGGTPAGATSPAAGQ
ncbi:tetratricopeptide repeat protein [Shimia sp.]|uniref:tetratricopeptide repeat protein n=1 Tax=Shimia sp. TaxID=1954381 RepID=UPI0032974072